jgi:hypothetical protein
VADRRRRVALLPVLAALLSLLLTSACAGVPKSGAVHRQDLPANPQQAAGVVLVAAGPQPHQSQTDVVAFLLAAMSADDTNVAQQFLTPDYADQWQKTVNTKTIVYAKSARPTLKGSTVSIGLTQAGVIDSSATFDATPAGLNVTFTLVRNKDVWQVSDISQPFLLVSIGALPDYRTPWHVYFPSVAATAAPQPRLVPDTVFLPPGATPSDLLGQLLSGPSSWITPAVYVTVTSDDQNRVNQATPNPRNSITTVDLHLVQVAGHQQVTGHRLDILKAQIAYTLNVQSFHTGSIQLLFDGVAQGDRFSVATLPKGYDPDVLPASAPVYSIAGDSRVVASTRAQSTVTGGAIGLPPAAAADTTETVLEHAEGVQQLAVASPTELPSGLETQLLAGVRSEGGAKTLVLATAKDPRPQPWTTVNLGQPVTLSTPSFDVTGTGVWTVATAADGTSTIYRVPLVDGVPGTPVAAPLMKPEGLVESGVTALKLSRDGSRAAVIVKRETYSQAYVGVVTHPDPRTGAVWSIGSLRPVITVSPPDSDVDVFWADQTEIGVVVQTPIASTKRYTTTVYRVSSDGYTVGTDGSTVPVPVEGAPTDQSVQLAGGPHQPWVASVHGQLSRQPTTDPSTDQGSAADTKWTEIGPGSYPAYAG